MGGRVLIPDEEYSTRIARAAQMASDKGLDVLLAHSNESDFANVRYFSHYWPIFETAGVAIASNGDAALLIGPESLAFAEDVSKIPKIYQLKEYRESADPEYPEMETAGYAEVFHALGVDVASKKLRIGVAGYLVTTIVQYESLKAAFPDAEIVRADDIMIALRTRKSVSELACLREGFRIVEAATQEVLKHLRPGVTELEMVGIAEKAIYENGAEYEGLPMYIFSEESTRHAISRPTYRTIEKGDVVQLNLSARVDGYSPSIGIPVSMGKLVGKKREIVEFGLEAHRWTKDRVKAGIKASQIAKDYVEFYRKKGHGEHYLYGPCHGLGMIEVEPPWMETTSNYVLTPSMTFQIDTFVSTPSFGVRWETGVVIEEGGSDFLSRPLGTIYELEV